MHTHATVFVFVFIFCIILINLLFLQIYVEGSNNTILFAEKPKVPAPIKPADKKKPSGPQVPPGPQKPADKKKPPGPQVPPGPQKPADKKKPPGPQVPPGPQKPADKKKPRDKQATVVIGPPSINTSGSGGPGGSKPVVVDVFNSKNNTTTTTHGVPKPAERNPNLIYTKPDAKGNSTGKPVTSAKATYQGASVPVLTVGTQSVVIVNNKPVYGTVTGGAFKPLANQGQVDPVLRQLATGQTSQGGIGGIGSQVGKVIASFAQAPQVISAQGQAHTVQQGNKATMGGKPVSTITIDGKTYANSGGKLYEGTVSSGTFKPTGQVNNQGQVIDSNGRPIRGTGSQFLASLAAGAATGGAIGGSIGSAVPIIGTAAGAGLGALIGTGGAIISSFLGGQSQPGGFKPPAAPTKPFKPPVTVELGGSSSSNLNKNQVNPNQTYMVYDESGKKQYYNPVVNKDGTVSFSQCNGPGGNFRSLSSCASTVVAAGAAVLSAIRSQKKAGPAAAPARILKGTMNTIADLNYAAVNYGLSYGEYLKNAATYFPTLDQSKLMLPNLYEQSVYAFKSAASSMAKDVSSYVPPEVLKAAGISNASDFAKKATSYGFSYNSYVKYVTDIFKGQSPIAFQDYVNMGTQSGLTYDQINAGLVTSDEFGGPLMMNTYS